MLRNSLYIVYAGICYILGLASLVGFLLFANNLFGLTFGDQYASLDIDHYNNTPSNHPALINVALIALFGLQHSVMARPWFKAFLTKIIPERLERATYVLMTAAVLLPLIQFWQPMTGSALWTVSDLTARSAITALYLSGYAITVAATYMLNHNHLFGLQQAMGTGAMEKEFRTPLFYKYVRHPIQTGVLIAMLATPDMTYGRALLAGGIIAYIFIGLYFEEKGLIAEFGDTYRDYRKRVPALVPLLKGF